MRRLSSRANHESQTRLLDLVPTTEIKSALVRVPVRTWCVHDPHQRRLAVYVWAPLDARGSRTTKTTQCATWAEACAVVRDGWGKQVVTTEEDGDVNEDGGDGGGGGGGDDIAGLDDLPRVLGWYDAMATMAASDAPSLRDLLRGASYTVVHEPMLQLNAVGVFASRVSVLTQQTHADACAFVPLTGESDVVYYAQLLADVLFGIGGTTNTLQLRRRNTLDTNLANLTCPLPAADRDALHDHLHVATEHKDDPHVQQRFNTHLQEALLRVGGVCREESGGLAQRVTFGDADSTRGRGGESSSSSTASTATYSLAPLAHNPYGFVVNDATDHRTCDLLLTNLPASHTFVSVLGNAQTPSHTPVHTYYDDLIVPLLRAPKPSRRTPHTAAEDQVDALTTVHRYELVSRLNVSRHPLLLYQLYQQLVQSADVPLVTLWTKDPTLKRQLLAAKYYQPVHAVRGAYRAEQLLLHAYTSDAAARGGAINLQIDNPKRVAHQMDVVVRVKRTAYTLTFDQHGTMRVSLDGFRVPTVVQHADDDTVLRTRATSSTDRTAFQTFVHTVVPRINHVLRTLNACVYEVPYRGNGAPRLLYLRMHTDGAQVYTTHNTQLRRYTASHRQDADAALSMRAAHALRYLFVPVDVRCLTTTTSDANASLRKCVQTHLRTTTANRREVTAVLVDVLEARDIDDDTTPWTSLATNFANANSTYKGVLLAHPFVPRFRLSAQKPTDAVRARQLVPLTVRRQLHEIELTLPSAKTFNDNAPATDVLAVHPNVFCEVAHLLVRYQAHRQTQKRRSRSNGTSRLHTGTYSTLPMVSAPSYNTLANIKAVFRDKYDAHVKRTKNPDAKYARVCHRKNQPFCLSAEHIDNLRRWCRYACTTQEHDYWVNADFRDRLRLLSPESLYHMTGAKVEYQFPTGTKPPLSHSNLVHNFCKHIVLAFASTTHTIVQSTLVYLAQDTIARLHQKPHQPTPSSATTPQTTKHAALTLTQALHEASRADIATRALTQLHAVYPDHTPLDRTLLSAWVTFYHVMLAYAELFVYLRHPTEVTEAKEPIYFCSPSYVCTQCKTAVANPETPRHYYADPASRNDLNEALQHTHVTYQGEPAVDVAFRIAGSGATERLAHYAYGDLRDTHVDDLHWMQRIPAAPPTKCLPCAPPYSAFGRLYALQDVLQTEALTRGGIAKATAPHKAKTLLLSSSSSHHARTPLHTLVQLTPTRRLRVSLTFDGSSARAQVQHAAPASTTRVAKGTQVAKGTEVTPCTLYREPTSPPTYHLTRAAPRPEWVVVRELPQAHAITCQVHVVDVERSCGDAAAVQQVRRARCTDVGEVVAIVVANGTTTLVNRSTQVVCARFRQRRFTDPLKTVCLPADVWRTHRHAIQVTLTGMLQYDANDDDAPASSARATNAQAAAPTPTRKRDRVRQAAQRQHELMGTYVLANAKRRRKSRRKSTGGVGRFAPKKKKGLDPATVSATDVCNATHTATLDQCVRQSLVRVVAVDTETDTDDSGLLSTVQTSRRRRHHRNSEDGNDDGNDDDNENREVDPSAVVRVVLQRHYCGSWALTFPTTAIAARVHALNLARQSRVAVRVEGGGTATTTDPAADSSNTRLATHTKSERTFPASRFVRDTPTTVRALVNDDEFFRCPMCAQALPGLVGSDDIHTDRVFRHAARAQYGNVVGLKSQEKSIKLDPRWLYVTTFKKFNQSALRAATYAANWGANHSADKAQQYRLPLGDKPQVQSNSIKNFGCTVVKANVKDYYNLQSFDLHTFFEQRADAQATGDLHHTNTFVVTGVEHSQLQSSLQRPKATLSQMFACVLGESTYHRGLTTAWLRNALTPARVLHAGDGTVVRHYGRYREEDEDDDTAATDVVPQAIATSLPPAAAARVHRTTRYLLDTFHTDTALTGDFHTWWELFTCIGYPKLRLPLYYFFFDVRQTEDATNFVPRLMCPPLALERYYWNPYTAEETDDASATVFPVLFFTIALKIQCRRTFTDAFYLLKRMRKTTEGAEYVYTCMRARVREFCDTRPKSVADAVRTFQSSHNVLPEKSGETLAMCINAYYYYKLFEQVQRCKRHVWTLDSGAGAGAKAGARIACTVPTPLPSRLTFHHEYLIDPHTLQITHRCYRHMQRRLFAVPVRSSDVVNHLTVAASAAAETSAPSFATPDAPQAPFVSLETAHKLLRQCSDSSTSSRNSSSRTPRYQLDGLGRIVAILLQAQQPRVYVPVTPVLAHRMHEFLKGSAPRAFCIAAPMQAHAHTTTPTTPTTRTSDDGDHWAAWQRALETAARQLRRTSLPAAYPTAHQITAALHDACETSSAWVKQMVARYVLQPTHSTVRTAVASGTVGNLRRYVNDRAAHAYRADIPRYQFPEYHTQDVFQTVFRQPTDTLFSAMLQKTDQDKRDEAAHETHAAAGTSRLLPPPWHDHLPNARVLTGDAFRTLAQSNSMQPAYVSATQGTSLVPEHVVAQHLRRQPVYVLNEGRVLYPTSNTDKHKALDVQHALVVWARPVAQSCTAWARMAHPHVLYVPHLPPVVPLLYKALRGNTTPTAATHSPRKRTAAPLRNVQLLVRHPKHRHVSTHHELTRIEHDTNGSVFLHVRPPLDWRKVRHPDATKVHARTTKHPARYYPYELLLDTQFHTVHHYELLKTRVKHKMKNLLYGQLHSTPPTTRANYDTYPLRYTYAA